MAAIFRGERDGLVGAVLSGGQHAAPDGTDVRRVPFGGVQHQDEASGGVERGLREVPWPGQRTRGASHAGQYPESGADGLRARERHLHPVSFTGTAADKSNRREVLRLAGRLSHWIKSTGLLATRR